MKKILFLIGVLSPIFTIHSAKAQFIDGVFDQSPRNTYSITIDKKPEPQTVQKNIIIKKTEPHRPKPLNFDGINMDSMNGPDIKGPDGNSVVSRNFDHQDIDNDASRPNFDACVHIKMNAGMPLNDAIKICGAISSVDVVKETKETIISSTSPHINNSMPEADLSPLVAPPLPSSIAGGQVRTKINGVYLRGYAPDTVDDPYCNTQDIYVLLSQRCMKSGSSHGIHIPMTETSPPEYTYAPSLAQPSNNTPETITCRAVYKDLNGEKSEKSWDRKKDIKSCLTSAVKVLMAKYGIMALEVDNGSTVSRALCTAHMGSSKPSCKML